MKPEPPTTNEESDTTTEAAAAAAATAPQNAPGSDATTIKVNTRRLDEKLSLQDNQQKKQQQTSEDSPPPSLYITVDSSKRITILNEMPNLTRLLDRDSVKEIFLGVCAALIVFGFILTLFCAYRGRRSNNKSHNLNHLNEVSVNR